MNDERFDTTVSTTCGYCGVGCRLEAHTRADRVVSISPAADGPANRGHTCLKGRFAHQFSRSRERLTTPLIREDGELRRASWDEALQRIATELGGIRAAHGPDAIAGLASSRATNEDCWAMQRLMRAAIGTNNIDNCSRVCHSPTSYALRASLGYSGATGSFDDIEAAGAAIIIGANPTEGHPVVGARIKQATLRGLKLVTIDPRRIELSDYAVLHLSPRPGTNAAVMLGLAHVVARDAADLLHRRRVVQGEQLLVGGEALRACLDEPAVDQAVAVGDVREPEQDRRVRPGARREVHDRVVGQLDPPRVDRHEPQPAQRGLLDPRADDRMALRRVRADDDRRARRLDVVERAGRPGVSERGAQRIRGRRVADARAVVDVVRADRGTHQSLHRPAVLVRGAR